jgi:DNA excision repair protein ERCC-6
MRAVNTAFTESFSTTGLVSLPWKFPTRKKTRLLANMPDELPNADLSTPNAADLLTLGVQVRPVSVVEREVVAAAASAVVNEELRDFEERDANFAAEIGALKDALHAGKAEDAPYNAETRLLTRKINQLEQRRRTLKEAHQARIDIARSTLLTPSSPNAPSEHETNLVPARETDETSVLGLHGHETQRDFDIRTGRVTPFQNGKHETNFERRAAPAAQKYPQKKKRPRTVQALADLPDGEVGADAPRSADGSSGADAVDALVPNVPSSVAESRRGLDSDASMDDEEVVFEGGLRLPASLFDRLYDYQKIGLQWMWELHTQQCGGILADEMGLGKTVQVVAFLAALQYSGKLPGPVIVVAPATVLKQWAREFELWWPDFHVRIMHHAAALLEPSRKRLRTDSKASNGPPNLRHIAQDVVKAEKPSVLITSYEQVRRYQDCLLDKFEYVVLDEGHKIRNPDAEITLTCKRFQTPRRILMTGTPLQNSLKELWSLFDFVFPGRLGTLVVFEAQFSAPIALGGYVNASKSQVYTAHKCAMVLRDLVAPYMLRRLKQDVAIQLPEKQEHILFCRLTAEQREAYKHFISSKTVRQVIAGRLNLLYAITMLRKICNHVDIATASSQWDGPRWSSSKTLDSAEVLEPGIAEDVEDFFEKDAEFGNWHRSGKMKVLDAVLSSWHRTGSRALLFSQTRTMLDILESYAEKRGFVFRRMDGQTAIASRMQLVDEFNEDPNIFLFLLTTKVGGVGVNLTGADRVLLFDPDWNPSTDLQARERAWRIGQKRSVMVYRLVTSGTIEEKIYHRQIYKQFLTNKVLTDARQRRFFKRKDIRDLFSLGDDQEVGTETGDLFAGTSARELVNDAETNDVERIGQTMNVNGDAKLLNDLFNTPTESGGLHSAIDHDRILDAGVSSVDLGLMQYEADKIATKAVEEVRRSSRERRRESVGIPTWTGRSGLAGLPRNRSITSNTSPSKASSLLQRMKDRANTTASNPSLGTSGLSSDSHAELMGSIIRFLRDNGGSANSDVLVDHFGDRVEKKGEGLLIFKSMLKKVAVLKRCSESNGTLAWVIRPGYEDA